MSGSCDSGGGMLLICPSEKCTVPRHILQEKFFRNVPGKIPTKNDKNAVHWVMDKKRRSRLVFWRKRAKLTQTEAGVALSTHRSTIVKLEHGEITLSDEWLGRLAVLYGCRPWELLEDSPVLSPTELELIGLTAEMSEEAREILLRVAQQMAKNSRD